MLKIVRFVNELMNSNCYVVYDDETRRCLVIDPGSEKSLREIDLIEALHLSLDYIIITHEHTDHNWGVNALRYKYKESKLICSSDCSKNVKKANRAYFLLYYDDPDYRYEIASADYIVYDNEIFEWEGHKIKFISTPGHSYGSICIDIDGVIFTGDTIMPYKPYFNGRDSNENDWKNSIVKLLQNYKIETKVYPGHGEQLSIKEWRDYYNRLL